jgi:hypothetical protein
VRSRSNQKLPTMILRLSPLRADRGAQRAPNLRPFRLNSSPLSMNWFRSIFGSREEDHHQEDDEHLKEVEGLRRDSSSGKSAARTKTPRAKRALQPIPKDWTEHPAFVGAREVIAMRDLIWQCVRADGIAKKIYETKGDAVASGLIPLAVGFRLSLQADASRSCLSPRTTRVTLNGDHFRVLICSGLNRNQQSARSVAFFAKDVVKPQNAERHLD